ncbi:MAG: DUF4868 domain-containing protein [Rhodocyclales bacterium]|nr:DUF4868 domain-containing protein [Rhodocyclales bacterium]
MTFQQTLTAFKALDMAQTDIALWVFKKSHATNGAAGAVKYRAHWVKTTDAVKAELRTLIKSYQQTYVEVENYSLLAQNNENSFLAINASETTFDQLKLLVDAPPEEHQAIGAKQLNNAAGYVVRARMPDGAILYGVKKTAQNWKTKRSRTLLNLVFREQELDIERNPAFTLERTFDFFVLSDNVLTPNKLAFESLLSYKDSYKSAFKTLQMEPQFVALFTTMQPICDYVGSNSIQLRRMAVIQSKALYQDQAYLTRLRHVNAQRQWNIQFDDVGRIVPTSETARAILQVLLDHRLFSELSLETYDVPSAVQV